MGTITKLSPRPESLRASSCKPNFRPKRPRPEKVAPPVSQEDLLSIVGQLVPAEVQALHWIAENADVIIVAGQPWLLTPAPKSLLDVLAAVGAGAEDREIDNESGAEDGREEQFDDLEAETDGSVADDVEPYAWPAPVWPADGPREVPYHAA